MKHCLIVFSFLIWSLIVFGCVYLAAVLGKAWILVIDVAFVAVTFFVVMFWESDFHFWVQHQRYYSIIDV